MDRIRTRPPIHPGEIIKHHYLKPRRLSILRMADALGVSRKTLSEIVNERASVTPDMALRLSRAFKTTPQLWLNLQQNYDLWHAARDSKGWKAAHPVAA